MNPSSELRPISFPAEALEDLRRELETLDEVTPFAAKPELAERIASVGIAREVGTINDEIARFVFDADRGAPVDPASLHPEYVEWRGRVGVRIRSRESERLEIRARGMTALTHPAFSYGEDGALRCLVVFPGLIARVAALEGVELVIVKTWARNSIFGGFDPAHSYYQTNFWELENNDSLRFADLVRRDRLALLGTHDLIAHVAGARREAWGPLRESADRVYRAIRRYHARAASPSVASLVLPYTLGVVLDDLAQPPTYGSPSHLAALDALLEQIDRNAVPPDEPTLLSRFPPQFARIIETSRDPRAGRSELRRIAAEMVAEIRSAALSAGGTGRAQR